MNETELPMTDSVVIKIPKSGLDKLEDALCGLIIESPHMGIFYSLSGFVNVSLGFEDAIFIPHSNNIGVRVENLNSSSVVEIKKALVAAYEQLVRMKDVSDTLTGYISYACKQASQELEEMGKLKYAVGYHIEAEPFKFDVVPYDILTADNNYSDHVAHLSAVQQYVTAVSAAKYLEHSMKVLDNGLDEDMIGILNKLPLHQAVNACKTIPTITLARMIESKKARPLAEKLMSAIFGI